MAHVRTQIRDAGVAAVTGLPLTGTNVLKGRQHKVPDSKLPALVVRVTDEDVAIVAKGSPPTLGREAVLQIDIMAKGDAEIDDTLDAILSDVETAIHADPTLGGVAMNCVLAGIEIEPFNDDGIRLAGVMRLSFAVLYRTRANAPETSI